MVEPHSSNFSDYNEFFGCPNISEIYDSSVSKIELNLGLYEKLVKEIGHLERSCLAKISGKKIH